MQSTVNKLRELTQDDVGIYHHVDGCYTVLGPVPMGVAIGEPAYAPDGSALMLRGIAEFGAPAAVYELEFSVIDDVLVTAPSAPKKSSKKAKKAEPEPAVEELADESDDS